MQIFTLMIEVQLIQKAFFNIFTVFPDNNSFGAQISECQTLVLLRDILITNGRVCVLCNLSSYY